MNRNRNRILIVACLLLIAAVLLGRVDYGYAQSQTSEQSSPPNDRLERAAQNPMMKLRSITKAEREAVAVRAEARRAEEARAAEVPPIEKGGTDE